MSRYVKTVAILAIGMFLGYRAASAVGKFPSGFFGAHRPAGATPVASPTGALLLSGFESRQDLARWQTKGTELEPSTLQATEGRQSGKVTFKAGGEAPSLILATALRSGQLPSNWSAYERLALDVFNPGTREVRLLVQLKDDNEKRSKTSLAVPAGEPTTVSVYIGAAKSSIDVRKVVYLNLFQWKPDKEATLYIDNVRLEAPGSSDARGASSAAAREESAASLETVRAGLASAEQANAQAFAPRRAAWASGPAGRVRVPLRVREPAGVARAGWLATGGVPLAAGQLTSADHACVVDQHGAVQRSQLRPLARWGDGSIKWLLVSVAMDLHPREDATYFLEYGDTTSPVPSSTSLAVKEDDQAITVETGPLRVTVSKERFTLFEQVWLDRNQDGQFADEEQIGRPGSFSLAHRGRRYDSRHDTQTYRLEIEERGPLSVTLKATGWFRDETGKGFCQFITRLQVFAGQRHIKVTPTFIYTGYPSNRYHFKHEGLKLPENETIQAIDLTFPLALAGDLTGRLGDEQGVFEAKLQEPLTLFQHAHDAYEWRGAPSTMSGGHRASGWAELADQTQGMLVVVRDFWQQFPKALTLDPQRATLQVALWPAEAGELDLQTTKEAYGPDAVARGSAYGLAKTHEFVVEFHPAGLESSELHRMAAAVQEPLHLRPSAEWVNETRVLGALASGEGGLQREEDQLLERLLDWAARQQVQSAWYGMLNFGDTLSWHRKEADDKSYDHWGWHPEGRWGWFNCEAVGTHTGALLQYLRTGRWASFQFGEDLTRHIMDVDTVHYNTIANDPRLAAVMDDEYSRVGSMHRHNADHWGGRNEEASHTNVVGILLYYYLTGDPRAHDVALEVGDFFLGEHITYSGHADIAPQRTIANVLWGDVWLYELTRDEAYLKGAVKWAHRLFDGQQAGGAWLETHDPWARTWRGKEATLHMAMYTMPALIAYHRLTREPKAATAIVDGTRYLVEHEGFYPFFDALAYSVELTGDASWLEAGQTRLAKLIRKQNRSGDPDWDGALSEKLTYGRVAPFLYSIPWLFDALEHAQDDDRR